MLFIAEHQGAKHKRSAAQELDNHRYPQKVKAKAKEKGLLVPTSLARRAKAKGKAKAVLKAIPKVYALALLLT